jgi:phosphohistidine phosphatase
MRRLLILRHAKSDWSAPGTRDADRPLSPRGREAAPRIGAYMAAHALVPDFVVCSTARRARESWELVAAALPSRPPTRFDDRLYGASHEELANVVRETSDDTHALLVIGHNPGLKDFAEFIVATGDLEAREQLHEKLPTAALAVIDFSIDSWASLHPRSGRLDRLVTPRSLEAAPE